MNPGFKRNPESGITTTRGPDRRQQNNMSKRTWTLCALLGVGLACRSSAQDLSKLNFNIGGGPSTPLNPTGQFAGVSGNFVSGVGYNIDRKNSISGEFMWSGLPPNLFILHPLNAPFGNVNLYALTANYRYHHDRISGSRFGAYAIVGGGWYYRRTTVDKNFIVPPRRHRRSARPRSHSHLYRRLDFAPRFSDF